MSEDITKQSRKEAGNFKFKKGDRVRIVGSSTVYQVFDVSDSYHGGVNMYKLVGYKDWVVESLLELA